MGDGGRSRLLTASEASWVTTGEVVMYQGSGECGDCVEFVVLWELQVDGERERLRGCELLPTGRTVTIRRRRLVDS